MVGLYKPVSPGKKFSFYAQCNFEFSMRKNDIN